MSKLIDFPPAIINEPNNEDYPIIRCDKCLNIPNLFIDIDKKEITLKCEKDQKIDIIPFQKFFDNINKYSNLNCCQLCKESNSSQKYFLCKTCSNKIICEKCFKNHRKDDEMMPIKIDSLCKKHFNQFESYCPICKENKCGYCSMEHEESHEEKEYALRHKMFKKNQLEYFDGNLKKIQNIKNKIEDKINSVINELNEKIELIEKLKNNFFESLNMQIKFTDLVYKNYMKKLKDFDLNYFVINNLENQMNFNLTELNIKNNDSLENKVQLVIDFINQNINTQFKLINKENMKYQNIEFNTNNIIDIKDLDYEVKKAFEFMAIGFFDLNVNLFSIYDEKSIKILDKRNYDTKFVIEENYLTNIKECKKIEEDKVLVLTNQHIIFIRIIDNSEYMILEKKDFFNDKYEFKSNLDLIYLQEGNRYYKDPNIIYSASFPYYTNNKSLIKDKDSCIKFKFINDKSIFYFGYQNLKLYSIEGETNKKQKWVLINEAKISISNNNCSIIDLNDKFYIINDYYKIYIINKNNLIIAKTISINSYNFGLLKISDKIISLFVMENYKIDLKNYELSMDGIKWIQKIEKNILKSKSDQSYLKRNNNSILFIGGKACYLVEIKTK